MPPPPAAAASPSKGLSLASLSKLPMGARVGIGAGLCIVVALVYWVVFYSEISARIATTNGQHQVLKTELANQQQAQASYFADRDDLALRQQRQREFNKILPRDTEVAGFISSIQTVANASGIQVRSFAPKDEVTEPFYVRVPMLLEIEGRFHQIVKFAYELGKLDRITNLENIEVKQVVRAKATDEVTLRVNCLATSFHALKQKEPGK